ncbi:MAG: hypothetical protein LLG00_05380 [Planctomycetaceae bacterium]|nr:hypothetical protein [Planctomycetaceae bacterium]
MTDCAKMSRLHNLRAQGFLAKSVALAVVTLVLFALVGPFAWWIKGVIGVESAAVAAAVCYAGGASALAVCRMSRKRRTTLLLGGMAIRMGLPLALALAVHFHGGPLAEAGLLYYLVVFYTATLAVETFLSLPTEEQQLAAHDPSAADEG